MRKLTDGHTAGELLMYGSCSTTLEMLQTSIVYRLRKNMIEALVSLLFHIVSISSASVIICS